jgi:outer membrane protein OmpA-like peptidoglycan-associated protein
VYPIPPKTITAYGAIPHAQPVLIPPKAPVKAPPQNVYPIPSQVVTGQGAVPQPQPIAIPPKAPVKTPPQNVYPVPSQVVTGQGGVPQPQPAQVPAKTPPQPVTLIPPLAGTGTQPPLPQTNAQTPQPTVIITHVASSNLHPQVLLRQQTLHSGYKFEQIEPTINNTHVDVYRGKDAAKMLYKDTLPMDKKGFHLAVLGIKEPTFTDTAEPLAAAAMRDFTFYFDFASVDIRPDQNELFSKIIDEHRSKGKRIIVVGETDNFGSEEYNRHLAVHRSTKIIEELKSRGVKDDEVELRVLVRCCRPDHPTQTTLAETRDQRITWVHFE